MEHVGIDLGARHSHICILSQTREVLSKHREPTGKLPDWLKRQPSCQVVMEACTQSPAVHRAVLDAGHVAKVVPGQLVRALGVGSRGIKTDERDALVLAQASLRVGNLPSVHLRSEHSCSLREVLSSRRILLDARKLISLSCKSWLRGRLITLRGRASSKHFSQRFRELALEHPDGLPAPLETLLVSFELLTDQLEALDQQVAQLVEQNPVCQNLMTVPGVGVQVSLSFMTQLDDPHRFASADELGSYLALVPGEATTGGKVVRTGTLKAGPRHLKGLLVQAAWSMYRTRPGDPMVLWARAIADKRGKRIAIVALARKLAMVMWSMWKHERPYDPALASSVRAPAASSTA